MEDPPYRAWLGLYTAPEYDEVVAWLRGTFDGHAEGLSPQQWRHVEDAFLISSRYEAMFWEMAWGQEVWP